MSSNPHVPHQTDSADPGMWIRHAFKQLSEGMLVCFEPYPVINNDAVIETM